MKLKRRLSRINMQTNCIYELYVDLCVYEYIYINNIYNKYII